MMLLLPRRVPGSIYCIRDGREIVIVIRISGDVIVGALAAK